ncbi:MAG: Fe-S cluster assembly ATPase SufC [Thermotogaceae bacterium]|jgi:Fe-S cluster assembly ATP-binding protein|nr:Fe-S cluster assembly ATPase SufC [Thermotogaceae bacterium]
MLTNNTHFGGIELDLLDIKELRATLREDGKEILKGVNLKVRAGELHAIMGPNGSGKSTLANVVMGNPKYEITSGKIRFKNKTINDLSVDQRARLGIFMSFQYPQEISGIRLRSFLMSASHNLKNDESILKKSRELEKLADEIGISREFIDRYLNLGFSGGEKKKTEIMQMHFLKPVLAILDEIDSGLDVDAIRSIAASIKSFKSPENGVILITHYERLLEYIEPDYVHIYVDGSIVMTGGPELARDIEERGYERDWKAFREA